MSIQPLFYADLSGKVTQMHDDIAHPGDVAKAYQIGPQSVHDARYEHKVEGMKYEGRVFFLWINVEKFWGARPDRFMILHTFEDTYALYGIHPIKKTVVRFIAETNSEESARTLAIFEGVKEKFVHCVALEEE